jgi:hypothetical protein
MTCAGAHTRSVQLVQERITLEDHAGLRRSVDILNLFPPPAAARGSTGLPGRVS